ncbi:MAG: acetate/propionate family kinase [Terriglobales bacterium]|jgi:acetate kinase|nr:acetate kinase [Terriglobales bacterium]
MNVLVLNSGSSSQKSCLYQIQHAPQGDPPECIWQGKIDWSGKAPEVSIRSARGDSSAGAARNTGRGSVVERMLQSLWSGKTKAVSGPSEIDVVGHRVVHGGPRFFEPVLLTSAVRTAIKKVSVFAPLHNRAELEGMAIASKLLGAVPQVAVFDTGFHHDMPASASTYPGPYDWLKEGIRRYGFHGINHQYCSERTAQLLRRNPNRLRIVTCHLGNGCSLAAIKNGRSMDTTMGFTPLEGLMMGTRPGSVDPGILTYLMRHKKLSGGQIDEILNQKSGLLGISGISGDMRDILAAVKKRNARAKLAFDIYIHRLRLGIGSMIAVLGGIDALVFTAGVGENSPKVRSSVCENLLFAGIKLDQKKNRKIPQDQNISDRSASVPVLVIHAEEDWMIARQCWRLLQEKSRPIS